MLKSPLPDTRPNSRTKPSEFALSANRSAKGTGTVRVMKPVVSQFREGEGVRVKFMILVLTVLFLSNANALEIPLGTKEVRCIDPASQSVMIGYASPGEDVLDYRGRKLDQISHGYCIMEAKPSRPECALEKAIRVLPLEPGEGRDVPMRAALRWPDHKSVDRCMDAKEKRMFMTVTRFGDEVFFDFQGRKLLSTEGGECLWESAQPHAPCPAHPLLPYDGAKL